MDLITAAVYIDYDSPTYLEDIEFVCQFCCDQELEYETGDPDPYFLIWFDVVDEDLLALVRLTFGDFKVEFTVPVE